MFIIKALFHGTLSLALFGGGFYVRHQLDPAIEAIERVDETRKAAATLWPF